MLKLGYPELESYLGCAGVLCPDGVLFEPIIAGSGWVAQNGIFLLQSCPPGYELVAQQCTICPASSYCKGGSESRALCRDGLFSVPGSNSSTACSPVVFVVTYITFPIFINEFATATKDALTRCLASVSGSAPGNILEVSFSEAGLGTTQAISKVAMADAVSAAYVRNKITDSLSSSSALAAQGLPGSALLSVTVTACPPGFELILGTGARSIGSDGQCEICPASYYCVGGSTGPSSCSTGAFSPPGSNSSSACTPSVFIIVTVTIPLTSGNFTSGIKQNFVWAIATSGGCAVDRVSILSISSLDQTRRASGSSRVRSQIAVPDLNEAADFQNHLGASSLNAQLAARGLPPASLDSVSVLAASTPVSGIQPWVIVLAVVGSLLVLLLAVLVAFRLLQGKDESKEEATLRKKILDIRQTFRLMPRDGFLLSTERRPIWDRWREVIVLRLSHVEAAARMALFQDFDVMQFNAFCLSLEGESDATSKERYSILCNWLLELSEKLIYPDITLPDSDPKMNFSQSPGGMSAAERFRFFTRKVVKVRIWLDDEKLFHNLKRKAVDMMEKISKLCEGRYLEMGKEPGWQELFEIETTMQEQPEFGSKWSRKGKVLLRTFSDGLCPLSSLGPTLLSSNGTSLNNEKEGLPCPLHENVVRQDHLEVHHFQNASSDL